MDADGDKHIDRESTGVSSTQFERFVRQDDWAAAESEYFISALTDLFGFEWEDVTESKFGTRERTNYGKCWDDETQERSDIAY